MNEIKREVTLTSSEVFLASMVGARRRIAAVYQNQSRDVFAGEDFNWQTDIEGACAEMAVAKALGIYWSGPVNTFKAPDVGEFQVRHTRLQSGSLIIRPSDRDVERFVLVTGKIPRFVVHGWILAADAKKERFLTAPNGKPSCWMVPQSELQPLVLRVAEVI
jgi:hypothetical protein